MLNQQIRSLRIARNMSQVELAHRLGISKQSVSNWENDNIQPSVEMLIKLAKIFSVSTDYLLGLDTNDLINVSGLPQNVVTHIRQLVEDFQRNSKI